MILFPQLFLWKQDKNRDVIVAFPDVDPSFISIPPEECQPNENPVAGRAVLKEITDSFDQPHLWYSTSEVIRALEIFIASGDELSESNAYRLPFLLSTGNTYTTLYSVGCT